MKIGQIWTKLLRLDSNFYAFASGIAVSIPVELLVNILSNDSLPVRWPIFTVSAALTFLASLLLFVIALQLDAVQTAIQAAPHFEDVDALWERLLLPKIGSFQLQFAIAFVSFIVGIGVLFIGLETKPIPNIQQPVCDCVEPTATPTNSELSDPEGLP